jgi:hypothetical protein
MEVKTELVGSSIEREINPELFERENISEREECEDENGCKFETEEFHGIVVNFGWV